LSPQEINNMDRLDEIAGLLRQLDSLDSPYGPHSAAIFAGRKIVIRNSMGHHVEFYNYLQATVYLRQEIAHMEEVALGD